ncbi:MAG TPA: GNAT family N-acetyltransferase [Acidimicrobiia bacterium]|nr:GNAT family N-acetyltransferase [Acidimicrobiia bacterium]
MHYREATAEDVDAIAHLHADSWRRNYRGAFSDAFLDGPVVSERRTVWTERLTGPESLRYTVVAEQNAVVVGFAHTVFDDDPTWGALVDNLHVVHGLKRHGIGRRLMGESAQAVVDQRPDSGLYLWVLQQNVAAQTFYEAIGGRRAGEGVSHPPGGGTAPKLRYAWPDPAALVRSAGGAPAV